MSATDYDAALFRIYSAILTPLSISSQSPPPANFLLPYTAIYQRLATVSHGNNGNYGNNDLRRTSAVPSADEEGDEIELSDLTGTSSSSRTSLERNGDSDATDHDTADHGAADHAADIEAGEDNTHDISRLPPPPPSCCFSKVPLTPNSCLTASYLLTILTILALLALSTLHSTYVISYSPKPTHTISLGELAAAYKQSPVLLPNAILLATYVPATETTTFNPLHPSPPDVPTTTTRGTTCLDLLLTLIPLTNTTSSPHLHPLTKPSLTFPPFAGGPPQDALVGVSLTSTVTISPRNTTKDLYATREYASYHPVTPEDYDYLYSPTISPEYDLSIVRSIAPVYEVTVSPKCLRQGFFNLQYTVPSRGEVEKLLSGSEGEGDVYLYYDQAVLAGMLEQRWPQTTGSQSIAQWLVDNFVGYDAVVVNSVTHSNSPTGTGYVTNTGSGESWNFVDWKPTSWMVVAVLRAYYLVVILVSYFLISNTTALLVRTLTVSGVAVVYPLAECLIKCGCAQRNVVRTLHVSYPWLGNLMMSWERYRAVNPRVTQTGTWAVVMPHLTKLFIFYVLYELSQTALCGIYFQKSYPRTFPVALLTVIMMSEYFSTIFIRTAEAVYFVPRAFFAYYCMIMMYFHFYPYSFSTFATLPYGLVMLATGVYSVVVLELPKFKRGVVCEGREREVVGRGGGGWSMYRGVNERRYVE